MQELETEKDSLTKKKRERHDKRLEVITKKKLRFPI